MSTTINAHEPIALSHLHAAARDLAAAIANTEHAAVHLSGARRTRADQLAEMVADALAFVTRLSMVVEGDLRADQTAR